MKKDVLMKFILWSGISRACFCVLVLLLIFFSGCDDDHVIPETKRESYQAQISEKLVPPSNLPDSKVTDFDSLRKVLLPIVLSTPDSRKLEVWYGRKNQWVPQLGNSGNLQAYIEHIYKEQIRDGKMNSAAATKLAKGRIFYLNAQYPYAVDQFQEALEISTNIGDSSMVGWSYINLSTSHLHLKDMVESEEFMDRAFEIANQIKNERLEIVSLLIKSGIHIHTGRMETAELVLKEVIKRSRKLKMIEVEKIGLLNLSFYHISTGDYDMAIDLLTTNSTLVEGDVSMVTAIHSLNLYEAYVGKGEDALAYEYLVEGFKQSDALDFAYGQSFCKKSMAEHHERRGEDALALKAFKEYHRIHEEQAGEQARIALQTLKTEQGFLEKDWEIERLTQAEQESELKYRIRRNTMLTIFAVVALGFLFFAFLFRYKLRTDYANQNKTIAETRLQVLQAQIKPHFIFNAIAGIQNSILKSETIEAYNYLGKFASMLRVMAQTATSISISLDQEIELINNYLALEKLRFRDGFVYNVEVSPELLNMGYEVPGMLVQPIVENAIVHGVSSLPYQGVVDVLFRNFGEGVKITVSDNGRGRGEAAIIAQEKIGEHLSISSENADKTLKALHSMGYKDADLTTLDLFKEDGTPAGTQVTIYLPFFNTQKGSNK